MQAAIAVWGAEPATLSKRLYAATYWPRDASVIDEQTKLLADNGAANFLPTKEQVARQAWEWTKSKFPPTKEQLLAMQLFCELQGYTGKDTNAPPPGATMPPTITYGLDPDYADDPDGSKSRAGEPKSSAA